MTYQLTHLYTLVLPIVTVKGSAIVEFKGVQNMNMHGLFTTTDADLIEALEATAEFKRNVFHRIGATKSKPASSKTETTVLHGQPEASKPTEQPSSAASSKSANVKTSRKSADTGLFD